MRYLTAKLFVFFCLISFATSAQTKEDKKLAKQLVGTWLVQKMSYQMDLLPSQNEEDKKRMETQQTLINKGLEGTNAKIKNSMALTFEKTGKMQVEAFENGTKRATKGTWKLENNQLQAVLEDKEMERTFNKNKITLQNNILEIFFDKPEEGVVQMVVTTLQFKKGALTDLNTSPETNPKE